MSELMFSIVFIFTITAMYLLWRIIYELRIVQTLSPRQLYFPSRSYEKKDCPDFLKNGKVYYWYADPVRVRNGNLRFFICISLLGLVTKGMIDAWINRETGIGWSIFLSILFFLTARKVVRIFYSVFLSMNKPIFALNERGLYLSCNFPNKLKISNFNTYVPLEYVVLCSHLVLSLSSPSIFSVEYLFIQIKRNKELYFITDNRLEEFKDYAASIQDVAAALNAVAKGWLYEELKFADKAYVYEGPKCADKAYIPSFFAWFIIIVNVAWYVAYSGYAIYLEVYNLPNSSWGYLNYRTLLLYNVICFIVPYRWQVKVENNPKKPLLFLDIPDFDHNNFGKGFGGFS